jgi:predicted transcriptional regulator
MGATVTAQIDRDLHERLRKIAATERRSLSQVIRFLLEAGVNTYRPRSGRLNVQPGNGPARA